MIFACTILGAAAVLAYWSGVLWLDARADRRFLAREGADRVFGEGSRG